MGAIGTGMASSYGTTGYRNYVLIVLTLAYVFNFVDRVMIGILAEPIIRHFSLTDTQFGLLGGIAFALFYTLVGVPVARLSERVNRTWIIGAAILLWSIMTVLCGLAVSFWMLFLFRLGVGIGEAGLTPPANSLISDYFAPSVRARALAIYAMGITLGQCAANLFVGLTGAEVTWQQTFIIIGLAGIPVGLLVLFTVDEPPRGYSEPVLTTGAHKSTFRESLKELKGKRSFWAVTLGSTTASFVGYGMGSFTISFLVRNHEITVSEAALWFMAPLAVSGAIGTWLCGNVVTRYAGGRNVVALWLSAGALIVSMVAHVVAFNIGVLAYVFPLLLLANFFQYWYIGTMYAAVATVAEVQTRATAVAVMLFITNLLGYGLGPLFVGWLSDSLTAANLSATSDLSLDACNAGRELLTADQLAVCTSASGSGLQVSVTVTVLVFFLAAIFFAYAAMTQHKDIPPADTNA